MSRKAPLDDRLLPSPKACAPTEFRPRWAVAGTPPRSATYSDPSPSTTSLHVSDKVSRRQIVDDTTGMSTSSTRTGPTPPRSTAHSADRSILSRRRATPKGQLPGGAPSLVTPPGRGIERPYAGVALPPPGELPHHPQTLPGCSQRPRRFAPPGRGGPVQSCRRLLIAAMGSAAWLPPTPARPSPSSGTKPAAVLARSGDASSSGRWPAAQA